MIHYNIDTTKIVMAIFREMLKYSMILRIY